MYIGRFSKIIKNQLHWNYENWPLAPPSPPPPERTSNIKKSNYGKSNISQLFVEMKKEMYKDEFSIIKYAIVWVI